MVLLVCCSLPLSIKDYIPSLTSQGCLPALPRSVPKNAASRKRLAQHFSLGLFAEVCIILITFFSSSMVFVDSGVKENVNKYRRLKTCI